MALSGYGLVPTGLLVPSRDTIRADFNADFRGKRGASLDLSDDDPLGQFVGLLCDRLHLLWLVMLVLYKSADRDAASDAALEALCMLTGTLRDEPLPSTVELVLGGVPGTVVPAKSGIKTASTGVRFTLDAAATIVAVDAWALDTTYAVGDRVHSAGVLFECRTAGDSANGGDGPGFDLGAATVVPGEPANLADGTVVWWLIGVGTGAVDAAASSVDTGPIVAAATDLNVIDNPFGGWSSALNIAAAELGRNLAEDPELRQDADADVFRPGSGHPDAIRQELLRLPGVETASVFFNPDSAPTAIGVPAHSVECLVAGGDDAAIAGVVFRSVRAGIGTFGNTTVAVKDSEGTAHDVQFSRPVDELVHVEIDLEKVAVADATPECPAYPADGDDQVIDVVVAQGNTLRHGGNVYGGKLGAAAEGITGVLGVTEVRIGLAPNPGGTSPISIGVRSRARFAAVRVAVTAVDGEV